MTVRVAMFVAVALVASLGGPIVGVHADTLQGQARQQVLPRGQMPELGRPTKVGDELPLFDFDAYFAGNWTFEWDMPEGAARGVGTSNRDDDLQGDRARKDLPGRHRLRQAPSGAFTMHEDITYLKDSKTLSRQITDSRGFAYSQSGTIGGDLGGIYNILLDGTPFTHNGHTHSHQAGDPHDVAVQLQSGDVGIGRRRAVQELRQPVVAEGHDRREMNTQNRWLPVVGGVMMNMALGMFYGMSVFMLPLEKEFGWTRAQTSWVSTIGLALIAVWYVIAGFIQDRRGPRPVAVIGGLLFSAGFFAASYTQSLPMFYLTAGVIAGTGSGFGYVVPTSVGSKWFPDKRGLVIGLMVGGYGAGSGVFGPIALVADRSRRLAQHLPDPVAHLPGNDDDRGVPAAEPAGRVRAAGMGSVQGSQRRAARARTFRRRSCCACRRSGCCGSRTVSAPPPERW